MKAIKGSKESEKNDAQEYLSAFKKINKLLKKHSIIHEVESINYEILVVNDNSKDQTENILKSFNAKNSRIRYR